MKPLLIEGNSRDPKLFIDSDNGLIEIKGRSILENHHIYFEPFFERVKDYLSAPQESTTINISLDYFDSRTTKILSNTLGLFKSLLDENLSLAINWYIEEDDSDIAEIVDDFMDNLMIEINKVEIPINS